MYIQIQEENTMEKLAKFIMDETTGLKYELCGDYYIIAGEDEPEREPIGVWGQRHLNHIQKHSKAFYKKCLTNVRFIIIFFNLTVMLKILSIVW